MNPEPVEICSKTRVENDMFRLIMSAFAGLTLVACSALDADTVGSMDPDASARSMRFNDSECRLIVDSRTTVVKSFHGNPLRSGDGYCEKTKEVAESTTTVALATISGDVAFDVNSANIKADFAANLDLLAEQMLARTSSRFSIIGHTDSTGSESYNQQLSERRAKAVADYLVTRGVSRDVLSILGLGESRPIGDNNTEEGQSRNRRVEVFELSVDN